MFRTVETKVAKRGNSSATHVRVHLLPAGPSLYLLVDHF